MVSPVGIAIDAGVPARFVHAIATLPRSFAHAAPGSADALVLSGASGWVERAAAAITSGARGVLVADPVLEPPERLIVQAAGRNAHVVVAPRANHDPSLPALRELVSASDGRLLECRVAAPHQLASEVPAILVGLLRAVDSPIRWVTAVSRNRDGLQAVATLQAGREAVISVDLTHATPPTAHLRVVGTTGLIRARIPLSDGMRPAEVSVVDDTGERGLPLTFGSSARAAVRALHAAMTDRSPDRSLDSFASDVAAASLLVTPSGP